MNRIPDFQLKTDYIPDQFQNNILYDNISINNNINI